MKPSLIVIGLGNPGQQYARTRHNAGFRAVDSLSAAYGTGEWQEKQKFLCRLQEARIVTVPVLLVQPSTFMNRSGECMHKLVEFYKIDPKTQVLVILDDIDLPLGQSRLRMKGGPGTHNGLRSIVPLYGEEYPRLRLGVGTPQNKEDLAAWVLSVPPPEEEQALKALIDTVPEMVKTFVMEQVTED